MGNPHLSQNYVRNRAINHTPHIKKLQRQNRAARGLAGFQVAVHLLHVIWFVTLVDENVDLAASDFFHLRQKVFGAVVDGARRTMKLHKVIHLQAFTRLLRVPTSPTVISTRSPALRNLGGEKLPPAPSGEPVAMRSPGYSGVKCEM